MYNMFDSAGAHLFNTSVQVIVAISLFNELVVQIIPINHQIHSRIMRIVSYFDKKKKISKCTNSILMNLIYQKCVSLNLFGYPDSLKQELLVCYIFFRSINLSWRLVRLSINWRFQVGTAGFWWYAESLFAEIWSRFLCLIGYMVLLI